MKDTLLYIQASPRGTQSCSLQVADAFVEAYRETHPEDELVTLDLFAEDLPSFDGPTVSAKYRSMAGQDFSPEEKRAWKSVEEIIDTFRDADKYVWAVPMWNFGVPYRLKLYIDILVQPGYTFDPSAPRGRTGLAGDKPCLAVYARGGAYDVDPRPDPFDFQKTYLEAILGFIGFGDILSIVVQPTLAGGPEKAHAALEEALKQARELAEDF